ncbi:UvrD-helicase domain-containing protein [Cyanobium sp. ATX 6A2]|uniref:UvrD-helicase domain-containing protein n=1 Tax=Cyanobium sp. ATX 6A2 TaxID=2823700 RepID=UPI0020CF7B50|nr:UvrD-helicase domain-containing protein [Cyanobium sp. ATX 6A2]MCP9886436.1 UvrD-helicase domain-containing protein [Cyanobium sp. ATX 6A2]
MSPPVLDFEANSFPLEPGVQLLEASAGTGKTFALAHLVLRLVTRPLDPLPLERLLVVTFTEAAAAELRDRIALRLQAALATLETDAVATDAVLAAWRAAQPDAPVALERLRGLLLLALEALDRTDITTIHGFCRRTLQRQALEAGLGPALELEHDEGERAAQVIHDYWQQHLLSLPPDLLAGLQQQGLSPERLQRLLERLDGDPALELDPLPAEIQASEPLAAQLPGLWRKRWQAFAALWAERGEALERAFCAAATDLRSRGASDTKPYAPRPTSNRVAKLDAWISAVSQDGAIPSYAAVLEQALLRDYFHPGPFTKLAAGFDGESMPGSEVTLPERPLLEAIAALVDGPLELVVSHALHHGRRELAQRRASRGRLGFGDLLAALDPGPDGDRHQSLLAAVASRYRVALIDEFQDTDPIQWRILQRAFVAAAGEPARHLLVMVGDPKQAIYRFRGGELATYRLARKRADGIHGLRENRRSAAALVQALNGLMTAGLVRSQLDVPPVQARAEKGELLLEPGESPLQLLPLDDDDRQPQQVAGLCLQLLRRRLRLSAPRPDGSRQERLLSPGDLCVLVGTHRQAELLRHALEQRGLPSRLVSRGDVFASEAATALQRLLDALADPGHPGRLRLLAASPLLGWSAEQLGSTPEAAWEQLADQLAQLAQRLERDGLLACLGELLSTEGLARLSLGGRLLADLQQAAELLQERMHQLGLGAAAAADWLRRIRLDPDRRVPEEHQLHSTAADAAIAVVTVHRSKGLEYPVVICPFLWRAPAAPTSNASELGRRWLPPGATAPHLDLHRSPHWGRGRRAARADLAAAEQEAERLAYVAATRARHLLVLGWREQARHGANPLAPWLLAEDGLRGEPELPLHRLEPAGLPGAGERWLPPAPEGELQAGPLPRHRLDNSWGRSSYSSWAHGGSSLAPAAREEGRDTSDGSADGPATDPAAWERRGPLADFPRGAGPGEALHRILEQLDYSHSPATPQALALIRQELERAGLAAELAQPLAGALERLRLTPFGGALGGFRLAGLAPAQRLNEMHFDLPLAVPRQPGNPPAPAAQLRRVRSATLARCFRDHPGGLFDRPYASRLESLEIASRGFLTGSIDLVFRQDGRWWVLDWKSNWLGERDASGATLACGPAHYGLAAMAELMAVSHYPLQAHLYLVALHRYLHWRLPGYTPERHLGGYAYVFLRGVPGATARAETLADEGGVVPGMLVERPPLARLLALDGLLREGAP